MHCRAWRGLLALGRPIAQAAKRTKVHTSYSRILAFRIRSCYADCQNCSCKFFPPDVMTMDLLDLDQNHNPKREIERI